MIQFLQNDKMRSVRQVRLVEFNTHDWEIHYFDDVRVTAGLESPLLQPDNSVKSVVFSYLC